MIERSNVGAAKLLEFKENTMSKLSFKSFCIEYYAEHTGKPANEIYLLFKQERLLDLLESDYEDLHGMGMEYLMCFFDDYLGGAAK